MQTSRAGSQTMLRARIIRTLLTNSTVLALGLGTSIILSRWLSPVNRGEIAAALLWPPQLMWLANMGVIPATAFFAAKRTWNADEILGSSMVLALIQSIIILPIGFMLLPWLLKSESHSVVNDARMLLLSIPGSLVGLCGVSILQGLLHVSHFNRVRTLVPIGYFAAIVVFIMFHSLTVHKLVVTQLVLSFVFLFATLATLFRSDINRKPHFNLHLARELLSYGRKCQLGIVSSIGNQRLDQFMMAAWMVPSQLGLYVTAVTSATLLQTFSSAATMVLTPEITRQATDAEREMVLRVSFRRYLILSMMAFVAIAALFPVAIPLVFGDRYRASIWPAEVLLVGALLYGARDVLGGGAQAYGQPGLSSRAEIVALAVTGALLLFLLPTLGIMGAAFASTAAYATALVVLLKGLQRRCAISPRSLFSFTSRDIRTLISQIHVLVRPQKRPTRQGDI